jgi:ankyrin repeat protein
MLSKMRGRILQDKYFNAIYLRNIPEITRCLNKGVNPNVRSSEYGVAPLHLLAERNDYILGYRLLECKDVNADLKSVHGYTALHIACNFNCKRFVGLLLQKGADPNLCDRLNKSPLHIAVERESYGIILKLLKAKANVNVLDCFENTPLSVGIVNVNNLLIVKTLLQYGVNMRYEHRRSLHIFFGILQI